ncbi:MAG: Gfo/Idh/MocA family oxidoreductase [Armatimonadetes bacterium]|nr:Gfo/Idh/MocA family oxidoreductase [Armatimonadota bacterium]
MSPLNIGIIGAGGIANKMHFPGIAGLQGQAKVTWIHGRKESRLKTLQERWDVPRFTHDYLDMLSDPDLDAVIVATPHPQHVQPGIDAIRAGKHLLMQKPLCGDMAEADAFVEAAEKTEKVVYCLPHFSSEVYKARQMVRDGAIGKPSGANCRTSHGGPEVYYAEVKDGFGETDEDLWFFDANRASVGALFDMGVYAVANLVAVLGTVRRVMGRVLTIDKPTLLEDTATLILEFENGALGTAETSWCDPARTWEYRIHGTAGKLTIPGREGASMSLWTPQSYTREDMPPKIEPVDAKGAGVGGPHEHWLDLIRRGGQPPLSHAKAARHVTEILLAGLESSRTGQTVELRTQAE